MRTITTLLFSLFLVGNTLAQDHPKLIVGIVVDQMRTDYIYRYWNKFEDGGFKRLVNEGYFCRNTHYNYIPTYTGPGHASIYTGTTPMNHGIIANNWYDKQNNSKMYCVSDANAKSVGTDNESGQMSPANLMVPTLGDAVRISSLFQGKSIGISIKDRGAILPAGHSANAAYWLDYDNGTMITSSHYMTELPKWVKQFNKAKHPDDLIKEGWEPMLALEKYTESTADDTPYEKSLVEDKAPTFPYDVKAEVKKTGYYPFATTPFGNTLLRLFADQCIIHEDLGQDEHTDLLAISFSSPDMIGHSYGPQSIEIEDTYLRLDKEIALLLESLDNRVGEGEYLLFLTADHAAAQVPQYLKDHRIPVDYFDKGAFKTGLESALKEKFGVDDLLLSYSNQQVFLNHSAIKKLNKEEKAVYHVVHEFALNFPGVANSIDVKQLQHPLPPDQFSRLAAQGWNPQRSGDVIIQFLPGWMEHEHKGTTHGSSYNYDTHVPLLFFGYGIPSGETLDEVDITQIVPTVSLISRITFPDASEHRPIKMD
ncbi:MAG: alkaline phosphatase PafA [Flavobacteriales bacterium]